MSEYEQAISSAFAAAGLVLVHLFAGKLRFLDVIPRSRWLSIAGGVSAAYVMLHLLPELSTRERTLANAAEAKWLEPGVYLLALVGLIAFYGLEKLARIRAGADESSGAFWLHIGSFALYNALIGYALVKEDRSMTQLLLFTIALALHFLVNDYGLWHHHRQRYRRVGRWLVSATILLGWFVGVATTIAEAVEAGAIAFLAGGILLNTFKEELPQERQSRFWMFALGAAAYSLLLLPAF